MFEKLFPLQNEGVSDRLVRFIIAIACLLAGHLLFSGTVRIVLYMVTMYGLLTSLLGYCVLYRIAGVNTLKEVKKHKAKRKH